jgi:opacity protein-like surface antigen
MEQERLHLLRLAPALFIQQELQMKKIILAAAIVGLSMGGAFAQTTGPSGQQDTNKVQTQGTMSKDGMKNDSMKKDDMMKKDTTTSGMSGGMKKGGESKDGDGMNKGGMSK